MVVPYTAAMVGPLLRQVALAYQAKERELLVKEAAIYRIFLYDGQASLLLPHINTRTRPSASGKATLQSWRLANPSITGCNLHAGGSHACCTIRRAAEQGPHKRS